jgi:uncharacterized integral membrane protein
MAKAKLIAAIVVLILLVIVFVQNSQPVPFKFLFFDPIFVPKTALILVSALFGVAVTLLVQFAWRRHKRTTALPATPPAQPAVTPLPPSTPN